jgi:outer membrane protein OmpA-like peptidoglycan-associated protein
MNRILTMTSRLTLPVLGMLALTVCSGGHAAGNTDRETAIGAIIGAVIGHQIDHDKGAVIGAVIGGISGASVGRYQDEQQRELERFLAQEGRVRAINVQRLHDETLKVRLSSSTSFDFGSAEIKPSFYRALNSLTRSLVHYDRTVLHIIGHTDSNGSDEYNYALSIQRAQAVAQYLNRKGVSSTRLRIEGRGELEPRSGNETEDSRRRNRRVEIFIKPVIEGQEANALIAPY